MHKGPPPGVGWRGPYADDRWCCPSQFWPQWVGKYMVAKDTGAGPGFWTMWPLLVKDQSLPGVASVDRMKMTWIFPPQGLGIGVDARIEMESIPDTPFNYGVVWRVRFAFASFIANFDYRSSTNVFTDFNMIPQPRNSAWSVTADLVSSTLLGPPGIRWFVANWSEVPH